MNKAIYIFGFIWIILYTPGLAKDTVYVNKDVKNISLQNHLYTLEDKNHSLTIDSLIRFHNSFDFKLRQTNNLNFEFSTSTYWITFDIKNTSTETLNYTLEIANPDLNYVNFFEVHQDTLKRSINTGELVNVESRPIYHRNYLLDLDLKPKESLTYFISVRNNGSLLMIPMQLLQRRAFEKLDSRKEIFNWLIQGVLGFVLLFNIYLYKINRGKINLYYSLNVVFVIITMLVYDGYFYLLDPSVYIEKLKWFYPCFYIVSLISFIQAFINVNMKHYMLIRMLQPIKMIVLVTPFFYFFSFPYSLVADIGIPFLVLFFQIINIGIASITFNRKYIPSVLLLLGFILMFAGIFVHQLKELNIIGAGFLLVDNSIKLGFTAQSTILTYAILERFRINQENAQKTIEQNYERIELQNKEFEIVNSELEKLSIVASETDNGIAIYNTDGRMEWCNKWFEQYYNVNIIDLIESNQDHISSIVSNDQINDFFNRCIKKEEAIRFESHVLTKGNKKIWVQTTLSPFKRANKLQKVISIDSDISNLKKIEKNLQKAKEEAEEADRLKTVFLGNMSHEIRTPLNGIIGFSDLLFNTDLDKEKRNRYLMLIKNNGEQLMNIIEDIVDISLIESNQLRVNLKETDLYQVFNETVEFFKSYRFNINKNEVEIEQKISIPTSHLKIITDVFRLKQVLTNLLKNAFKFTEKGQVRLGCYKEDDHLLIYVEDTGIGVEPNMQEQIFMRFRQAEETLTRKYGGNGLGLTISKGIVEKLGGTIWLDTEYKEGARFCFTLPLNQSIQSSNDFGKESTGSDMTQLENLRFLIVEDHDSSYEYLEEILLQADSKLSRAVNGKEAVDMVKNNNFDIVLMDISLPEMDGVEAVQEIRKFNNTIPVIAQTAHAMLSQKDEILEKGFNDIITKPVNKKLLLQKINKLI